MQIIPTISDPTLPRLFGTPRANMSNHGEAGKVPWKSSIPASARQARIPAATRAVQMIAIFSRPETPAPFSPPKNTVATTSTTITAAAFQGASPNSRVITAIPDSALATPLNRIPSDEMKLVSTPAARP